MSKPSNHCNGSHTKASWIASTAIPVLLLCLIVPAFAPLPDIFGFNSDPDPVQEDKFWGKFITIKKMSFL